MSVAVMAVTVASLAPAGLQELSLPVLAADRVSRQPRGANFAGVVFGVLTEHEHPPQRPAGMLRITTTENGPQRVLKLEGKLLGPWTSELVRACRQARGAAGQTSLDLSAITFIDTAGVVALRELQRMGVTIGRSSSFVAEMLNGGRE